MQTDGSGRKAYAKDCRYGMGNISYTPPDGTRSTTPGPVSSSQPRKIKGIIFDLGGVVVKWDNAIAYRYIEEKYGIAVDTSRRLLEGRIWDVQTGNLDEKRWMADFFMSVIGSLPDGYERLWDETFDRGYEVDEGVVRIIRNLRERGYMLALLSNIEPSHAAVDRRKKTTALFDKAIYSCEVGLRKPDIGIFKLAGDNLGLKTVECVFIDDIQDYVKASEDAGMKGVLYKDANRLIEDLRKNGVMV
jgi:putative hydrolase of the HAD superfamily